MEEQEEKATRLFTFPLAHRGEFPERSLAGHQIVIYPFLSNTCMVSDKYPIRHLHKWQLMSDNHRWLADLDVLCGRHNVMDKDAHQRFGREATTYQWRRAYAC